jgi:hypothetical protein
MRVSGWDVDGCLQEGSLTESYTARRGGRASRETRLRNGPGLATHSNHEIAGAVVGSPLRPAGIASPTWDLTWFRVRSSSLLVAALLWSTDRSTSSCPQRRLDGRSIRPREPVAQKGAVGQCVQTTVGVDPQGEPWRDPWVGRCASRGRFVDMTVRQPPSHGLGRCIHSRLFSRLRIPSPRVPECRPRTSWDRA